MTRETKIGLLVGLAFIIVVGILLNDYRSTSTDPKPATLSEAGANVRQSVTTPGAPAVQGDQAPRAQVPTRGDLAPRRPGPPVRIVEVGPGNSLAGEERIASDDRGPSLPPIDAFGKPSTGRAPGDLVAQHPQDFERVGDTARNQPPVTPPKSYLAESGDTVSRIASKLMTGGNSKANREALIKANPSLQTDGNVVYLGKTYVIPSAGAAAQATDATAGKPATPAPPSFATPPAAVPNTVWYTVKENDNLWRIAAHELGDGNQWTAIRDLNKDVLKGGETVKANMRIRLPRGGATASVN
jgi:nucleoid-associated protein YgaU